MIFFNKKLKDVKLEKDKYIEHDGVKFDASNYGEGLPNNFYVPKDIVDDVSATILEASQIANDYFKKKKIEVKPFFDDELLKHIRIFESFIKTHIPDHKGYVEEGVDGYKMVNWQAFLDARDFLYKEMHIDPFSALQDSNLSGVYNDKWVFFSNGYSVDENGIVRDKVNHTIFNPKDPSMIVTGLDLFNKVAIFEGGIRVKLPNDFIKNVIEDNEYADIEIPELGDYMDIPTNINKDITGSKIVAVINGRPVTDDDSWLLNMKVEDLFSGDIWGENMDSLDFMKDFRDTLTKENLNEMCNYASIPYAELNDLLLEGGGQRGVMPLASSELTDEDIKFGSDGTAYYSASNATVSVKFNGCKTKKYHTAHAMMWSNENPVGIKRSRLQRWWKFCNNIGLFNANIPKLVGFKKFKVFPGLCIGGLVAHWFASQQEEISKRINEMFRCVPAEPPLNPELTGFSQDSYQSGEYPSVNLVEDLDKILSVNTGDKYIVKLYEKKHTGLSTDTCAVFTYDPNREYRSSNIFYYGSWSGKVYEYKKEVETESSGNLMEGYDLDYLGEDSISAKLLSLQYAFMKKQVMFSKEDYEMSIERCFENIVTDIIERCDLNIGAYQYFEEFSQKDVFGNRHYLNTFYEYFRGLEGDYKFIDLSKFKTYLSSNGSDGSSYQEEYYPWNRLDDTYIKPHISDIPKYDVELFVKNFVFENESLAVIKSSFEKISSENLGTSKYAHVKTLWDYIQMMENKEFFIDNINSSIDFKNKEMEWADFTDYAIAQLKERVWGAIKNSKIL